MSPVTTITTTTTALFLFLLSSLVHAQSESPTPTPSENPPPAPPAKPAANLPFIIIDVQWTQLIIGMGPIILSIIVLTSLYGFVWTPWWKKKMAEVEKEYNRREKERYAGGFGAKA